MLIVFTGNGKGKTTASLGQMMRMVGRGKNALMIQFIKGPWKSGEDFIDIVITQKKAPDEPMSKFKLVKMGLGFVGILGDTLPKAKHCEAAEQALAYFAKELATKKWDIIVLDEINVAVQLKLLRATTVLKALKKVPLQTFIILTGRGAPPSFIRVAHLATEMREIKHPFNKGELAKIALDF